MKLHEKAQSNETENEEPNETKYITDNMGEVNVKNNGFKYVYGKYNSEEIQIANLGLVGFKFKENFDYIMNIINQYGKIHEITKKAIIKKFKNDESIRHFFFPYNSFNEEKLLELLRNNREAKLYYYCHNELIIIEELLEFCGIDAFEGFDINKAVDKLKYPRFYFADNSSGRYGKEEIYFEVQYRISDEDDLVLEVFMDSKLKIYCFDCCRPITIDLK
jgi:hypothetical protein